MHCLHCGKQADGLNRFCTNCGKPFPLEEMASSQASVRPKIDKNYNRNRILIVIAVIAFMAWAGYSESKNNAAIQKANNALDTYNSNDSVSSTQQVIQELKSAYDNATDDSTKLGTLKSLALAYDKNNDTADELSALQEGLRYASIGSLDYYYLSGNIAELKNNPKEALSNFNQAYSIKSDDYQINNELGLFYLDLQSQWKDYDDNAKALQYEKAAYALNATNVSTENLALAYYFNNDYQQSIDLLLPLDLNAYPSMALYLGLDYLGEKDQKNARLYFQKAVDLGVDVPQDVTNYLNSTQ